MQPNMQYFNSIEAAKVLNVNVSTIKRWTQEGKLKCVKTPGGHRKFTMQHLAEFLESNKTQISKANLYPAENEDDLNISSHVLKRDYEFLIQHTLEQALQSNRENVQRILNGLYMGQIPLYEIYDKLVTPVMHRVGDLWASGTIGVTEEHFSTQTIRDCLIRLQGSLQLPSGENGRAFCLIMSSELHDIALKMVDHILELRGVKVYFSGQMTPSIKIERVFQRYRPDRVYISSTIVENQNLAQAEFDKICYISAEYHARVYVGGQGFDVLDYSHPAVAKRLNNYEDLFLSCEEKALEGRRDEALVE
ncbi:MAG: B12-binding domain-containing protein [Candidatus Zhuqueibacterota bacterium]